jgi:hypothetical protein
MLARAWQVAVGLQRAFNVSILSAGNEDAKGVESVDVKILLTRAVSVAMKRCMPL